MDHHFSFYDIAARSAAPKYIPEFIICYSKILKCLRHPSGCFQEVLMLLASLTASDKRFTEIMLFYAKMPSHSECLRPLSLNGLLGKISFSRDAMNLVGQSGVLETLFSLLKAVKTFENEQRFEFPHPVYHP
jgi:hypothetical protein